MQNLPIVTGCGIRSIPQFDDYEIRRNLCNARVFVLFARFKVRFIWFEIASLSRQRHVVVVDGAYFIRLFLKDSQATDSS